MKRIYSKDLRVVAHARARARIFPHILRDRKQQSLAQQQQQNYWKESGFFSFILFCCCCYIWKTIAFPRLAVTHTHPIFFFSFFFFFRLHNNRSVSFIFIIVRIAPDWKKIVEHTKSISFSPFKNLRFRFHHLGVEKKKEIERAT